jgi:hypothetical protein
VTAVLVVPRSLNGVFRHFDDLSSLALLPTCSLGQRSVYRRKRVQHSFVQGDLIRVDSSGMLTQVVQSRKGFAAVTRERSFTSVFPTG